MNRCPFSSLKIHENQQRPKNSLLNPIIGVSGLMNTRLYLRIQPFFVSILRACVVNLNGTSL